MGGEPGRQGEVGERSATHERLARTQRRETKREENELCQLRAVVWV
jgi:CRISPR/Cas system Type II protein with McrA/HNH and RuvC-like nuclease domain